MLTKKKQVLLVIAKRQSFANKHKEKKLPYERIAFNVQFML